MAQRLHSAPGHEPTVTHASKTELRRLCAREGDRLVIRSHHVGEPQRDGEIVEVRGDDGAPPYVVRWSDDGHVSRVFPGSDAFVERPVRMRRR